MSSALTVTVLTEVPVIEFAREFDAPVVAVFRAHREPALVAQWLGPDGYEMDVRRWDFQTQGGYRYIHRAPDGGEYAFNGVFHIVRENEFAIQTFEFEGAPDVVALESMTFIALPGGRTRLEGRSVYPDFATRDATIEHGMEVGLGEGYTRLEALVVGLAE